MACFSKLYHKIPEEMIDCREVRGVLKLLTMCEVNFEQIPRSFQGALTKEILDSFNMFRFPNKVTIDVTTEDEGWEAIFGDYVPDALENVIQLIFLLSCSTSINWKIGIN